MSSQIPLGSRIIAVCDAYDAMTSDRPYHQGIGTDAALEELRNHAWNPVRRDDRRGVLQQPGPALPRPEHTPGLQR